MPRGDLTRFVVLCTLVLAAACARRSLAVDAGVQIGRDAGDVWDAVAGADGRVSDTGSSDAPPAIDVPPAGDGAGADGPLDGAIADAGGDGGSGIPCGIGLTCSGTDICVTLNLCGGPVDCRIMPDGGECPAGSTLYPDCPSGQPGCIPDCPGPSYRCEPRPAGCGAALSCACLPGVCPFTSCISAQGRNVFCANS